MTTKPELIEALSLIEKAVEPNRLVGLTIEVREKQELKPILMTIEEV